METGAGRVRARQNEPRDPTSSPIPPVCPPDLWKHSYTTGPAGEPSARPTAGNAHRHTAKRAETTTDSNRWSPGLQAWPRRHLVPLYQVRSKQTLPTLQYRTGPWGVHGWPIFTERSSPTRRPPVCPNSATMGPHQVLCASSYPNSGKHSKFRIPVPPKPSSSFRQSWTSILEPLPGAAPAAHSLPSR